MKLRALAALLFVVATSGARAVILLETGDTEANTTAPEGALAGSGWQYQGVFGGFLGTPIAPRFFLSAKHVGNPGAISFGSASYAVVAQFRDPTSDLAINQVAQDLPIVAPLYTKSDEMGKHLVVIGRGTRRGGEMLLNGELRGWAWGAGDGRQRWGENDVVQIVSFSSGPDDGIYATCDRPTAPAVLPNESHLSVGDSSGAVFIQDGGTWKLAGINYAVDDLYFAPGGSGFTAAIFDARGYYSRTGPTTYDLLGGPVPVPTGFYATRVSSKLAWIYSVIDPQGDADGNGTSNLLEYALRLNSTAADPDRQAVVTHSASDISFVYRKLTDAPSLQYQVEQSEDLRTWSPAASQETLVGSAENVATVNAKITSVANGRAFLRLSVSQN